MDKKLYKDYFDIDPKYFPQVTEALIKEGKVSWKSYFPNESFLNIIDQTCDMVNGKNPLSIFTWGPYGSGKSHLLLTLISMINAEDSEIEEYFNEQKLSKDLMNKFIAMKNSGKIITIHRISSANISTETDLIIAVQQSIMAALEKNGIENCGEASMKDSFLEYISDPDNRNYFSAVIRREKYAFDFSSLTADKIEEAVRSADEHVSESMMRKVITVLRDIGQYGILKDANAMSDWIKDIIDKNNIKAIIFGWDEFHEFLGNHQMNLTGFQTLLEISNSHPFYFITVSHESEKLFNDSKSARKFLDRFQKPIEISLPENTAFKLMAQAMKITDDPVYSAEWIGHLKPQLNGDLSAVRQTILGFKRGRTKSKFTDDDMKNIVPIHPYAALVLRQIASMFNSNQRSMFDFIINENGDYGFKNFINSHGPFDKENLLTVDMLWDFFCGKQINGLSDDVRGIFLSYDSVKAEKLLPDDRKVLKTILILQAVSVRLSNDDLLSPNEETLDLTFKGTDWQLGKAIQIAKGLVEKGFLFEKPMANGKKEYCVVNGNVGTDDIKTYREQAVNETKTAALIVSAELPNATPFPKSVEMRYIVEPAAYSSFQTALNNHYKRTCRERIKVIITYSLNDTEMGQIRQNILKNINMQNNDVMFIETLAPMGKTLYDQYIEALAFSKYYKQKDKEQAKHFESQAASVLRQWSQNIASGAFIVYAQDSKNGVRKPNLADLQDFLIKYDLDKYSLGLEHLNVSNATLYGQFNLAQGAECGINQETKSAYRISNKNSLEKVLEGAWKVNDYWNDPSKKTLPIVKVKNRIDEIITDNFEKNNGEVSILAIYDEMEKPPFGFMPTSITSFVLGFCLKEYANSNYFWSNHSNSETMTPVKMKLMIANALNQRTNEAKNYKEEYIVSMTPKMRQFLKGTSVVFKIPEAQCTSLEGTRDQIRIKMKSLQFPIWCIKTLLPNEQLEVSADIISEVIDCYTGIANTANTIQQTESGLAERIGQIYIDAPAAVSDLAKLINDDKCREGMLAYIGKYKDGKLCYLASEINDGGEYLDAVKKKFSAGDSNWVWNTTTADEKISDVILDYMIIAESNKSLSDCHSMSETVSEWNRRTNNIKMPCEVVAKQVGDLGVFLWQLQQVKMHNGIDEQDKHKFYDALCAQREAFDAFYKNQEPYFIADAKSLLSDLDDTEKSDIFHNLPSGQFTKSKHDYYNQVQQAIESYVQNQWKKKMQAMWFEKTGTNDPVAWSAIYQTPILCMIPADKRSYARKMFDIIKNNNPAEDDAKSAIEFMEKADFYDRLNDPAERDKQFMENIVGANAVLLNDINDIRSKLSSKVSHEAPYYWLGSSAIQNCIRSMVDKAYKLKGSEMANQIIDKMDAAQLREYLKRRIADDAEFGIQILKGEGGDQ